MDETTLKMSIKNRQTD
ncbi:hypothetical protein [Mycoplasmopsis felis]